VGVESQTEDGEVEHITHQRFATVIMATLQLAKI
jgi:hypothetical protein